MKTLKRWILLLVLVAAALGIWNLIDFAGSHLAQFPDTKAGRNLAVYAMAECLTHPYVIKWRYTIV